MASRRMIGVDFLSQDRNVIPPRTTELDSSALYEWFTADHPSDVVIRILSIQIDREELQGKIFKPRLPDEILKHANWKHDLYSNLTENAAGGAFGVVDEPYCYALQTPIDGDEGSTKAFCSLTMQRRGLVAKGVYFYKGDIFDPVTLSGAETGRSGWRASGLQVTTFPYMVLRAHAQYVSRSLQYVEKQVADTAASLAHDDLSSQQLGQLNRTLHICNAQAIDLERRSRFEQQVIEAIESIAAASQHGTVPWPLLDPQKSAVSSRGFEFESLPRRIKNARATISTINQERSEQINLELTQASYRIAEATLKDAKSMKTIAILTMLVLPGTAVASIFSMSMFDWSAKDSGQIASKWLWVYFAVSIPLTGLTLVAWWLWTRQKRQRAKTWTRESVQNLFRDEEADRSDIVELQSTIPKRDDEG